MHAPLFDFSLHLYVCVHVCVRVCVHMCVYASVCVRRCVHACVHVQMCHRCQFKLTDIEHGAVMSTVRWTTFTA